jgi:hypothetical protein
MSPKPSGMTAWTAQMGSQPPIRVGLAISITTKWTAAHRSPAATAVEPIAARRKRAGCALPGQRSAWFVKASRRSSRAARTAPR